MPGCLCIAFTGHQTDMLESSLTLALDKPSKVHIFHLSGPSCRNTREPASVLAQSCSQ